MGKGRKGKDIRRRRRKGKRRRWVRFWDWAMAPISYIRKCEFTFLSVEFIVMHCYQFFQDLREF